MKPTKPIGDLLRAISIDLSVSDLKKADILSDISLEITRARLEKGMNQKELADYMGVSQGMISRWESGSYNFTIETLIDVFCKLDIDLNMKFEKVKSSAEKIIDFPTHLASWEIKHGATSAQNVLDEEAV